MPERIRAPVEIICWVLEHVSALDIVLIYHAHTLHGFLCSWRSLELRLGKWLVLKMSKADRLARTR